MCTDDKSYLYFPIQENTKTFEIPLRRQLNEVLNGTCNLITPVPDQGRGQDFDAVFAQNSADFHADLELLNASYSDHLDASDAQIRAKNAAFSSSFQDSTAQNAGAACGLVLLSTSHTDPKVSNEYAFKPIGNRTLKQWWDDETITIDKAKARVSRLQKAVGVAAKWIDVNSAPKDNKIMVTTTYRKVEDWRPNHIADYIACVRTWYSRIRPGKVLRYVWVAELQKRGAVHYHVIFWLEKGLSMPKADKRGWWKHGCSNTIKATKAVGYIMKYATKADSKTVHGFPKGCRLYGIGGIGETGRRIKRACMWPDYIRCNASIHDNFRPRKGGGYINLDTGEVFLSEYVMIGADHCHFLRVRHHPTIFNRSSDKKPGTQCLGPFSWLADKPARQGEFACI